MSTIMKKNRSRHYTARQPEKDARAAVAAVLAPVLAGAFGGIALEASIAPSASAASTFPGYTTSYYVDTTNASTIGDLGCYDTGSSASGARNVVLDFGQQVPDGTSNTGWGTNTWDVGALPDYSASNPSVLSLYKAFANGWRYCNSSLPVWLGLGTNNYGSNVGTSQGADWGSLVGVLASDYSGTNIHARGANDIELDWNVPSVTKNWIGGSKPALRGQSGSAGFQASGQSYFDYGDATGCNASTGKCDNAWTTDGAYNKDYGFAGAVPLPEAYNQGQADWWTAVDSYAVPSYSGAMATPGYDTPPDAWQYLANATGQYTASVTSIQFM